MAEIIAIVYPDEHRAREVIESLKELQDKDAATFGSGRAVVKDADGKLKIESAGFRAAHGGRWWHKFFGAIVVPGFTQYEQIAPTPATFDEDTANYSLDKGFVEDLTREMQPGSSAVFLVVLQGDPVAIHKRLAEYGGSLLYTNLDDTTAQELQAELDKDQSGVNVP